MSSLYRPTYNMRTLEQAAGAAPTLAALQARIQQSQRYLDMINTSIPAGLRPHVQAGPLDNDGWCLFVRNAAAATKIRQLLPRLLDTLIQNGAQINAIRVKVQAASR